MSDSGSDCSEGTPLGFLYYIKKRTIAYPLYYGQTTFGTSEEADVRIKKDNSSGIHAFIDVDNNGLAKITRSGSEENITVNNIPLRTTTTLKSNDMIQILGKMFQYSVTEDITESAKCVAPSKMYTPQQSKSTLQNKSVKSCKVAKETSSKKQLRKSTIGLMKTPYKTVSRSPALQKKSLRFSLGMHVKKKGTVKSLNKTSDTILPSQSEINSHILDRSMPLLPSRTCSLRRHSKIEEEITTPILMDSHLNTSLNKSNSRKTRISKRNSNTDSVLMKEFSDNETSPSPGKKSIDRNSLVDETHPIDTDNTTVHIENVLPIEDSEHLETTMKKSTRYSVVGSVINLSDTDSSPISLRQSASRESLIILSDSEDDDEETVPNVTSPNKSVEYSSVKRRSGSLRKHLMVKRLQSELHSTPSNTIPPSFSVGCESTIKKEKAKLMNDTSNIPSLRYSDNDTQDIFSIVSLDNKTAKFVSKRKCNFKNKSLASLDEERSSIKQTPLRTNKSFNGIPTRERSSKRNSAIVDDSSTCESLGDSSVSNGGTTLFLNSKRSLGQSLGTKSLERTKNVSDYNIQNMSSKSTEMHLPNRSNTSLSCSPKRPSRISKIMANSEMDQNTLDQLQYSLSNGTHESTSKTLDKMSSPNNTSKLNQSVDVTNKTHHNSLLNDILENSNRKRSRNSKILQKSLNLSAATKNSFVDIEESRNNSRSGEDSMGEDALDELQNSLSNRNHNSMKSIGKSPEKIGQNRMSLPNASEVDQSVDVSNKNHDEYLLNDILEHSIRKSSRNSKVSLKSMNLYGNSKKSFVDIEESRNNSRSGKDSVDQETLDELQHSLSNRTHKSMDSFSKSPEKIGQNEISSLNASIVEQSLEVNNKSHDNSLHNDNLEHSRRKSSRHSQILQKSMNLSGTKKSFVDIEESRNDASSGEDSVGQDASDEYSLSNRTKNSMKSFSKSPEKLEQNKIYSRNVSKAEQSLEVNNKSHDNSLHNDNLEHSRRKSSRHSQILQKSMNLSGTKKSFVDIEESRNDASSGEDSVGQDASDDLQYSLSNRTKNSMKSFNNSPEKIAKNKLSTPNASKMDQSLNVDHKNYGNSLLNNSLEHSRRKSSRNSKILQKSINISGTSEKSFVNIEESRNNSRRGENSMGQDVSDDLQCSLSNRTHNSMKSFSNSPEKIGQNKMSSSNASKLEQSLDVSNKNHDEYLFNDILEHSSRKSSRNSNILQNSLNLSAMSNKSNVDIGESINNSRSGEDSVVELKPQPKSLRNSIRKSSLKAKRNSLNSFGWSIENIEGDQSSTRVSRNSVRRSYSQQPENEINLSVSKMSTRKSVSFVEMREEYVESKGNSSLTKKYDDNIPSPILKNQSARRSLSNISNKSHFSEMLRDFQSDGKFEICTENDSPISSAHTTNSNMAANKSLSRKSSNSRKTSSFQSLNKSINSDIEDILQNASKRMEHTSKNQSLDLDAEPIKNIGKLNYKLSLQCSVVSSTPLPISKLRSRSYSSSLQTPPTTNKNKSFDSFKTPQTTATSLLFGEKRKCYSSAKKVPAATKRMRETSFVMETNKRRKYDSSMSLEGANASLQNNSGTNIIEGLATPRLQQSAYINITDSSSETKDSTTPKPEPIGVKKLSLTKYIKSPKNDLTSPKGVKKLMKTPKVIKSPKNDLTSPKGIKRLLKTPRIIKSPKNDLTSPKGIKKLLKTPKIMKSPKNDLTSPKGVKKLLKTPKPTKSPKNDLTSPKGVKKLLKTPKPTKSPKNDLTSPKGVKKLMKTPKITKSPRNDLTSPKGIKKLFKTPKIAKSPRNDLTSPKGVKKLLKTPKINKSPKNDLTSPKGIKKLFKNVVIPNSPKNDLTSPKGVKQLFKTPKITKLPKNDLTSPGSLEDIFKTPELTKSSEGKPTSLRGNKILKSKNTTLPESDLLSLKVIETLPEKSKSPREKLTSPRLGKRLLRTRTRNLSPENDSASPLNDKKLTKGLKRNRSEKEPISPKLEKGSKSGKVIKSAEHLSFTETEPLQTPKKNKSPEKELPTPKRAKKIIRSRKASKSPENITTLNNEDESSESEKRVLKSRKATKSAKTNLPISKNEEEPSESPMPEKKVVTTRKAIKTTEKKISISKNEEEPSESPMPEKKVVTSRKATKSTEKKISISKNEEPSESLKPEKKGLRSRKATKLAENNLSVSNNEEEPTESPMPEKKVVPSRKATKSTEKRISISKNEEEPSESLKPKKKVIRSRKANKLAANNLSVSKNEEESSESPMPEKKVVRSRKATKLAENNLSVSKNEEESSESPMPEKRVVRSRKATKLAENNLLVSTNEQEPSESPMAEKKVVRSRKTTKLAENNLLVSKNEEEPSESPMPEKKVVRSRKATKLAENNLLVSKNEEEPSESPMPEKKGVRFRNATNSSDNNISISKNEEPSKTQKSRKAAKSTKTNVLDSEGDESLLTNQKKTARSRKTRVSENELTSPEDDELPELPVNKKPARRQKKITSPEKESEKNTAKFRKAIRSPENLKSSSNHDTKLSKTKLPEKSEKSPKHEEKVTRGRKRNISPEDVDSSPKDVQRVLRSRKRAK